MTDVAADGAGAAPRTLNRSDAFRAARRHSTQVRLLKFGLALAVAGGVSLLIIFTLFQPFRGAPEKATVASVGISGSRITMELPRLSGFRQDSRPYTVTAKSAIQDVRKPNVIELNDLDATIAMGDDSRAHVTALLGIYDTVRETMDLKTNVRMKTDTGYEVRLESAAVDFKAGSLVSGEPVRVFMTNGTITANSMRVADGGKAMVFEGDVKTVMLPPAEAAATAAELKGTTQ